jgi:cytochrome bd-type quinol oxidase subunit 2
MRPRDQGRQEGRWTTYFRSYLLTVALFLLVVPGWVVLKQGDRSDTWPWWSWPLLALLVVFGLVLAGVGLLARGRTVERWADMTSTHEASLLLMVLAFPCYTLLRMLHYRGPAPPPTPQRRHPAPRH